MIATSKLTRKNQTTLPKAVVRTLGIKPADQILYMIENGRVTLRVRTGRVADLAGKFVHFGKRSSKPLPVEAMSDAVAQAVADDYERKFGRRRTPRGTR